MESHTPEENLERTADELEDRLSRLDGELDHARDLAQQRAEETERMEDFTGDYKDAAPDETTGDDAKGSPGDEKG